MNIQTLATKYNKSELDILIDYIELSSNKPIGELEIDKDLINLMLIKYDNTLLKDMYNLVKVKKDKKIKYLTIKELSLKLNLEVLELRELLIKNNIIRIDHLNITRIVDKNNAIEVDKDYGTQILYNENVLN